MARAVLKLVSFVFFLSGTSALIFETVWFRQAGLAFGNSVWASALVLSSSRPRSRWGRRRGAPDGAPAGPRAAGGRAAGPAGPPIAPAAGGVLSLRRGPARPRGRLVPHARPISGTPSNWILLGTRGATAPLSETRIRRQWADPRVAARLRAIGIERAEQLAALFLADAPLLEEWVGDAPPLVDNWPRRAPRWQVPWVRAPRHYASLTDQTAARAIFEKGAFIARMWPVSFREKSLPYFEYQRMAREYLLLALRELPMGELHRVLTRTSLETLALWLLGSDVERQAIVDRLVERGRGGGRIEYELALRALAERDYALAAERLARVPSGAAFPLRDHHHLYALCMAGRVEEAQEKALEFSSLDQTARHTYWSFMQTTFGVRPPPGLAL